LGVAVMGGISGEIRGQRKIDIFIKYLEETVPPP
jgi:hypothetical protein